MPTRPPLAWALNLDAELELASPGRYQRTARMATRIQAAIPGFARWLPPGDVVVAGPGSARGMEGRAWCPTPLALEQLTEAGARLPEAPSVDVLRRVNERGFAFDLAHLPSAARCTTEDEVERALGRGSRQARWLLKRGLAFAGRGQRRIDGATGLSDADRAFVRASLRQGALYVEPRVEVLLEVGLHGIASRVAPDERGQPTVQEVDRDGQWRASRLARPDELAPDERATLEASFDQVLRALHDAGYFGPFGVDAFRCLHDGALRFHPLSEINARYSMGFAVGMGGLR